MLSFVFGLRCFFLLNFTVAFVCLLTETPNSVWFVLWISKTQRGWRVNYGVLSQDISTLRRSLPCVWQRRRSRPVILVPFRVRPQENRKHMSWRPRIDSENAGSSKTFTKRSRDPATPDRRTTRAEKVRTKEDRWVYFLVFLSLC